MDGPVPASPARPGRVVIVTGPPGAGKSTVARALARRGPLGVHLHCDDFWHYIRSGWIAPYRPEAHRQNEVVVDVLAGAAFGYAAGGYQVFCDGIVGPWFLGMFSARGRARGIELHYAVLRPDRDTTLRRAAGRGSGALTDPEPIDSLYRQFTGIGEFETHALDTTRLTVEATVDALARGLDDGAFLLDAA